MFIINDQVKNDALKTLLASLNESKDSNIYVQTANLLQIVSDADSHTSAGRKVANFMSPYITALMQYETSIPDFTIGILYPSQPISERTIVQLLSLLRFDALKEGDSEYLIEFFSYFIDALKLVFNVNSAIFKKCTLVFSDYGQRLPSALYYAFETFTPPIGLLLESKAEWEAFLQMTRDKNCEEKFYMCQVKDARLYVKYKTDVLDGFSEDKFPLGIRLTSQRMYKPETCKDDSEFAAQRAEMVKQAREMLGGIVPRRKKNLLTGKWSWKKLVILALVFCFLGGGLWAFFHYRDVDIEDWMVGEWIGDGGWNSASGELRLDKDGTIYIRDWQIVGIKVRYNKITDKLWVASSVPDHHIDYLPSCFHSFLRGETAIEVDSRTNTLSFDEYNTLKLRDGIYDGSMQGSWTGTQVVFDEFGWPVRLRLVMTIDEYGHTTEKAYKNGELVGERAYLLKRTLYGDLYFDVDGRRVNYRCDDGTIATTTGMILHRKTSR